MYVVVSASCATLSFHFRENAGDGTGVFRILEKVAGGREGEEGGMAARSDGGGVVSGGGGFFVFVSGTVAAGSGAGVREDGGALDD